MTKKLNKQKDFQKRDIGHIFLLLSTSAGYSLCINSVVICSTFSSEFRHHILHAASWKLRLNNIIYSISHPFGITLILYYGRNKYSKTILQPTRIQTSSSGTLTNRSSCWSHLRTITCYTRKVSLAHNCLGGVKQHWNVTTQLDLSWQ